MTSLAKLCITSWKPRRGIPYGSRPEMSGAAVSVNLNVLEIAQRLDGI